jgi:hypothetical protein
MSKWKALTAGTLSAGVLMFAGAGAQTTTPLTALDYIEIQQLNNKYNFAIDTCANNGRDYADLFTADATWTSGRDGRTYKGRDELMEAAGGGARGCKKLERTVQSHITVNLVVTPSPEGATGVSYLVYPGVKGEIGNADQAGHVGGYQDVYVKTPNGWRFKSRIHVHPPQVPGKYSGIPNTKREAAGASGTTPR